MTVALAEQLGLGDRELVAFVGAGGKSTMLFGLGDELAAGGGGGIDVTTSNPPILTTAIVNAASKKI